MYPAFFFIHLYVDGNVGCFHILPMVCVAARNSRDEEILDKLKGRHQSTEKNKSKVGRMRKDPNRQKNTDRGVK